jgi:hypothetical protein
MPEPVVSIITSALSVQSGDESGTVKRSCVNVPISNPGLIDVNLADNAKTLAMPMSESEKS